MSDDSWKGGTDPQAYVDSLKQDALTMVEQELKPCPFCGGQPTSMWNDASCGQSEDCGFWSIDCCVSFNEDSEEEAVTKWNTRPTEAAAEARGMEKAAKIADNRAKASETAIKHLPDEDKSYLRGSLIASEQIAAKIRAALGGQHE